MGLLIVSMKQHCFFFLVLVLRSCGIVFDFDSNEGTGGNDCFY